MAEKKTQKKYVEPVDYFPKEIRKKYGLGEFDKNAKKPAKTTPKKK